MKKTVITSIVFSFILISTAMAAEFSADMISIVSGFNDKGKVYYKNSDTSRTEVMGMINILKKPHVYQVFPDSKKYYVSDLDSVREKNPLADADNLEDWAKKHNFKKIKSETFQGFKCDVYDGKVKMDDKQAPLPMKIWYSKKLDYAIKTISTMAAPMGEVTSYLENIKIGKQPDSLFTVPAGYAKAASMEEAMGMEGMGLDGKNPFLKGKSGQMPTEEEMEAMGKKMQEMMKKKK